MGVGVGVVGGVWQQQPELHPACQPHSAQSVPPLPPSAHISFKRPYHHRSPHASFSAHSSSRIVRFTHYSQSPLLSVCDMTSPPPCPPTTTTTTTTTTSTTTTLLARHS